MPVSGKKIYKKIMGNKKHLQREYGLTSLEECEQNDTRVDYVAIYHASYIKCALLPQDINNAYKMADSDRVLSTAKFQMLLSGSNRKVIQSIDYGYSDIWYIVLLCCLLIWYMLNCLANLQGDIGHNIPCKNLVKILASANSEQKNELQKLRTRVFERPH